MYQTIQVSSCLSIQGEFVEDLANGQVVIRDGGNIYRGLPIRRNDASMAALMRGMNLGAISASERM